MKRSTSLLLMLMLAFQAGCYSRSGPATPLRPQDAPRVQEIEDAPKIEVLTRSGRRYQLRNAVVERSRIRGTWMGTAPPEERAIPLDSVAEVQVFRLNRGRSILVGVAGGLGFLVLVAALNWQSTGSWDADFGGWPVPTIPPRP